MKGSDQILIKKDKPVGIDFSQDISYLKSPYYQKLFSLHSEESEYKYVVFAHESLFHVQKFRLDSDKDASKMTKVNSLGFDKTNTHLVQEYTMGSQTSRCINIEKLILDDSEF